MGGGGGGGVGGSGDGAVAEVEVAAAAAVGARGVAVSPCRRRTARRGSCSIPFLRLRWITRWA